MIMNLRPTRNYADWRLSAGFRLGLIPEVEQKVFCIGFQRNGTTSTGDFCERQLGMARRGYRIAQRRKWSRCWYQGALERIFSDPVFRTGQVFDDGPWWFPKLYETLYEKFPQAKFVMFDRDPEAWFRSMVAHSGGRSPGFTDIHARIYRREDELRELSDGNPGNVPAINGFSLEDKKEHYIGIYRQHNEDAAEFFARRAPDRFFRTDLNDPEKFRKMACFLGFEDRSYDEVRSNVIASK
ncbi:sulfotransferase [Roseovarius pacificus]|uniref:sulfotransferase n=1 Tax=Roseovarius pacificus TaxID=337701 RepID=UPI002A18D62A|nr:sulfotransferase [Roseovarius pacificus]